MHSLYSWVRQPSFYHAPASYLSEDQERLQKRAMKILYPGLSHTKVLELLTLYDRREAIAAKLFHEVWANKRE